MSQRTMFIFVLPERLDLSLHDRGQRQDATSLLDQCLSELRV